LALKQKLADLQDKIGVAEQLDEHTKKLAAAKRALENAIAQAETAEEGVSAVATQNFRLASLFTLSREPGEGAQHWVDQWLAVLFGAGITFAAQFFNALAWVSDRPGKAFLDRFAAPQKPIAPVVPQTASVPSVPAPERIERVVERHMLQPVHMGASLYELGQLQLGRVRPAAA